MYTLPTCSLERLGGSIDSERDCSIGDLGFESRTSLPSPPPVLMLPPPPPVVHHYHYLFLPGAWRYRISSVTGWPGVRILRLGETESLICSVYLSVAVRAVA